MQNFIQSLQQPQTYEQYCQILTLRKDSFTDQLIQTELDRIYTNQQNPQPIQIIEQYKQIILQSISLYRQFPKDQYCNYTNLFEILFRSYQILKSEYQKHIVPVVYGTYLFYVCTISSARPQPQILKFNQKLYFKNDKGIQIHRNIFDNILDGYIIHHKNGNSLDNRVENLSVTFNNKKVSPADYHYYIQKWDFQSKKVSSEDEYQIRLKQTTPQQVCYQQHYYLHKIFQTHHEQKFFVNCVELDSDLNLPESFYTQLLTKLNRHDEVEYEYQNVCVSQINFDEEEFYNYFQ
ncbi:Hypothetical_protein [Hexamita inflata]|uniref:Hypothetical_protein n=1 Tax=Hexamita inflata TaxID=28002 RepID=A0AA86UWN1_9EUKA|nr:Hypothetical protein HINF_LOCUS39093 [Hexamita inflata]